MSITKVDILRDIEPTGQPGWLPRIGVFVSAGHLHGCSVQITCDPDLTVPPERLAMALRDLAAEVERLPA